MFQQKAKKLADALGIEISPLAMGAWVDFAYSITLPFDQCGAAYVDPISCEE